MPSTRRCGATKCSRRSSSARSHPNSWPVHLAKMYDFWSSVMLTTGRYKGNPLGVHMRVEGWRRACSALAGALPRHRRGAVPAGARGELPREIGAHRRKLEARPVLPAGAWRLESRRRVPQLNVRKKRFSAVERTARKRKIAEQSQFIFGKQWPWSFSRGRFANIAWLILSLLIIMAR